MSRFGTISSALFASFVTLSVAGCGEARRPDGGVGLLPEGALAPEVSGVDQNGNAVALGALKGKPVVVYFYPADGTPGCTKEACAFRDVWKRYESAGVALLGVSTDDRASHQKFAQEHSLPFPLIDDSQRSWARAFGVSTTMGMVSRVTFLIGRDGRVAKLYRSVDAGVHANQVLTDVASLATQ
ncbi:MAG: redoxin domain-containing protein [Polyangiaceae bacterium]